MGATFSRVKTWVAEIFNAADINAEFNNILDNLTPAGIDDASANLAAMQATISPGTVGAESLPTSLEGEIRRLRYVVQQLAGSEADYWYDLPGTNLSLINSLTLTTVPRSRIESGPTMTNSAFLKLLIPAGSSAGATIDASPTPIVFWIDGTKYTQSADIALSSLSTAPSTNNTCLVNGAWFADQDDTRIAGMHGTVILVDNVGSNISADPYTLKAWKLDDGSGGTEYFLGHYDSVKGAITKCQRGCFIDSTGVAKKGIPFADNDTITLMKLGFVFLKNDGTAAVSYTVPSFSGEAPTSPAVGDYWFDHSVTYWKSYSGAGWVASNSTLIGMVVMDSSNCVAARSYFPFKNFDTLNTVDIHSEGTDLLVRQHGFGGRINVWGTAITGGYKNNTWSLSTDLDTGAAAANKKYYMYMTQAGDQKISLQVPLDLRGEIGGFYHPTESWRCLGSCETGAGSTFVPRKVVAFARTNERSFASNDTEAIGTVRTLASNLTTSPNEIPPGWIDIGVTAQTGVSISFYNALYDRSYRPGVPGTTSGSGDGTTTFGLPRRMDIISPWETWSSPETTWVSNVTVTGKYRRVGNEFEGWLEFLLSGAPTATSLIITLPHSLAWDATQYPGTAGATNNTPCPSMVTVKDTGTNAYFGQVVVGSTVNTVQPVYWVEAATTLTAGGAITATAPITFANTDRIWVNFRVPIDPTTWTNASNSTFHDTRCIIKALE